MRLQRVAFLVLLVFVAGIVSATALDALLSAPITDQVGHAEGSACPDPDDHGRPCGPACACTCCPGHATRAILASEQLLFTPPFVEELNPSPRDELHPKEVYFRIFHPPRA